MLNPHYFPLRAHWEGTFCPFSMISGDSGVKNHLTVAALLFLTILAVSTVGVQWHWELYFAQPFVAKLIEIVGSLNWIGNIRTESTPFNLPSIRSWCEVEPPFAAQQGQEGWAQCEELFWVPAPWASHHSLPARRWHGFWAGREPDSLARKKNYWHKLRQNTSSF